MREINLCIRSISFVKLKKKKMKLHTYPYSSNQLKWKAGKGIRYKIVVFNNNVKRSVKLKKLGSLVH